MTRIRFELSFADLTRSIAGTFVKNGIPTSAYTVMARIVNGDLVFSKYEEGIQDYWLFSSGIGTLNPPIVKFINKDGEVLSEYTSLPHIIPKSSDIWCSHFDNWNKY